MGERRIIYRGFPGKPEGKAPLGTPKRKLVDNNKIGLQGVGCGVWIGSSWLRIGTAGKHL
jgi:hypothetical protein